MSNELEQVALDNAADDHDRRHTLTPTPQVVETVGGPHSRACGARKHEHGPECHQNCPTCAGKDPMTPTPDVGVLAEVRALHGPGALDHCGADGVLRYRCKGCGRTWSDNAPCPTIAILDREAGR